MSEVHSNKKRPEEMRNFTVVHETNDELTVILKIPEPDDYALQIYAKEGNGGSYLCVCSYLVVAGYASIDPTPFPTLRERRIGSASGNKYLKITPKSHTSPLIDAPISGELEIIMATPVQCEIFYHMILKVDENEQSKDEYVFQSQTATELKFQVRIPEAGNYALKIYGKESGKRGDHTKVYTYLIQAKLPCKSCLPFPRTYLAWGTGCELLEPVDGILPTNQTIHMALKVPTAVKMAANSSSQRCYLKKEGDGIWRCNFQTQDKRDELKLSTAFTTGHSYYDHILKYKVPDITQFQKECQTSTYYSL